MSREKGGAGCVKLTRANQIVLYLTNYTPSMLPTVTFANEQLESALANSARTTATCCGVGSQVAVASASLDFYRLKIVVAYTAIIATLASTHGLLAK